MLPLEKVSELAPAPGENVGVPQPEVAAFGVAATTMLPGEVGRLSEKLTPETPEAVGLLMTKVRVELPPVGVELGEKALAIVSWVGSMIEAITAEVEKSLL